MFHSRPSEDDLDAVTGGMFSRWSAALVRAGLPAPSQDVGIDVQRLDDDAAGRPDGDQVSGWARYLAKGLAGEAVLGTAKEAHGGNRSIRQLMTDALVAQRWEDPETGETAETLDDTARDRLAEYERVMRGVVSSPGAVAATTSGRVPGCGPRRAMRSSSPRRSRVTVRSSIGSATGASSLRSPTRSRWRSGTARRRCASG